MELDFELVLGIEFEFYYIDWIFLEERLYWKF